MNVIYCQAYSRQDVTCMLNDFESLGKRRRRQLHRESSQYEHHNTIGVDAFLKHGTVEFRQHAGTIRFTKIAKWVKITESTLSFAQKINNPKTILQMQPRMFRQIIGYNDKE